ncbi:hypothetical protein LIER_08725 [Lithospermum erythrorhizon]|uniref:Retrovirus-related Pol polyprotein from transposon TNT 1-94-like beta-barrel domain-containing protein n=1 Tax=Lithospermum erythrorhizon TaxID=34254 RepID=A0AAV3PCX8_LITER
MCQVLTNLRAEFSEVRTNILPRVAQTSIADAKSQLMAYEYMLAKSLGLQAPAPTPSAISQPKPPAPSVHYVQRTTPAQRQYQQPRTTFQPRGTTRPNVQRSGGRSCQNFQQQTGRFQLRSNWESHIQCQLCGQRDHLATACPQHLQFTSSPSVNSVGYYRVPSSGSSPWYPDTGATNHVTPNLSQLQFHDPYYGPDSVRVADGSGLSIKHVGTAKFISNSSNFQLNHILHVPNLSRNLLSIHRFCVDNNATFEFTDTDFIVNDNKIQKVLLKGPSVNGLYVFPHQHFHVSHQSRPVVPSSQQYGQSPSLSSSAFHFSPLQALTVVTSSSVWHHRLGHPHLAILRQVLSKFPDSRDRKLNFQFNLY